VIWGAYHGVLLVGYHYLNSKGVTLPTAVSRLLVFVLIVIGWVFFRATDMTMAMDLLHKMFVPQPGEMPAEAAKFAMLTLIAGILARWAPNAFEYHERFRPVAARMAAVACVMGLAIALIAGSRASPFLYFQF
jgi:alginate O-acetyltransferase complex protein AlgI